MALWEEDATEKNIKIENFHLNLATNLSLKKSSFITQWKWRKKSVIKEKILHIPKKWPVHVCQCDLMDEQIFCTAGSFICWWNSSKNDHFSYVTSFRSIIEKR